MTDEDFTRWLSDAITTHTLYREVDPAYADNVYAGVLAQWERDYSRGLI